MKNRTFGAHDSGKPGASDRLIRALFREAAMVSWREPRRFLAFTEAASKQKKAAARRRDWRAQDVQVPSLATLDLSRGVHAPQDDRPVVLERRSGGSEMNEGEFRNLLLQSREQGVSLVVLKAGTTPINPGLLEIAGDFSEIQFLLRAEWPVFEARILDKLLHVRNVTPMVVVKGLEKEADLTLGEGPYGRLTQLMDAMRARRLFFGVSLMVTRQSYAFLTSRIFVRDLVNRGCRLFSYTDFVPSLAGTEHLAPSAKQQLNESLSMMLLRREFPALFVATSALEQTSDLWFGIDMASLRVDNQGDEARGFAPRWRPAPELEVSPPLSGSRAA